MKKIKTKIKYLAIFVFLIIGCGSQIYFLHRHHNDLIDMHNNKKINKKIDLSLETRVYAVDTIGLHMKIEKPKKGQVRISFSRDSVFGNDYIDWGCEPLYAPEIFLKGNDSIIVYNQYINGYLPKVSSDKFKIAVTDNFYKPGTLWSDAHIMFFGDMYGFQVWNENGKIVYILEHEVNSWKLRYAGPYLRDSLPPPRKIKF